jgi:hypothetical protein
MHNGTTSNGTTPSSSAATLELVDAAAESPTPYLAYFREGLDLFDDWDSRDAWGKLGWMLQHLDNPQLWFQQVPIGYFAVLAHFRHTPAGKWQEIKAHFKAIGGNP